MIHRQNTKKHRKITTEKPKTKITHRWTTSKTHKVHHQTQEKTPTPPLFSVAFTFDDHFLESLVFQSIFFQSLFFNHFFPSCFFNQSIIFQAFSTTFFQSLFVFKLITRCALWILRSETNRNSCSSRDHQ